MEANIKIQAGRRYQSNQSDRVIVATREHADGSWFYGTPEVSSNYHEVGEEYAYPKVNFDLIEETKSMEPLNYLQDIANIDFNKTYLLIHVDEYQTSTPFINTGKNIISHLLKKTREQSETINDVIEEMDLEIESIQQHQFIQFIEECAEYVDSLDSELNELGYQIYELS